MDRAGRRIGRRLIIAAIALFGLMAAVWTLLPNGKLARIERIASCYDAAALPQVDTLANGRKAIQLRVLLWNVEGLPWPIRSDRGPKLAAIADWIAKRRAAGLGPDILVMHKAFIPEASRIAIAGRFATIAPGPALGQPRLYSPADLPSGYAESARWSKGEGIGKWLDGGLYIATDLPVARADSDPFGPDSCAGYDCLANKGAQLVKIAIPGAPKPLYLFNTHRNSREPAGVSLARAEVAHILQTHENDELIRNSEISSAFIAAGDFNNYRAGDRVGWFATDPEFRLVGKRNGFAARPALMSDPTAWQQAYDLLGYEGGDPLRIEPLSVATLFDGKNGPRLSDHDAQYVIFRISWRGDAAPMPVPIKPCTA